MRMTRREFQRLEDLLGQFFEMPGLDGSERDEISHVRFIVGEVMDGSRDQEGQS